MQSYKVIGMPNYDEIKDKDVIIWCCSISGLNLYRDLYLAGIHVIGFADSSRLSLEGTSFAGLQVYTFDELKLMRNCTICIATRNQESQRQILGLIDRINGGADVYVRNLVFPRRVYDNEKMKEMIKKDTEIIRIVKDNMADEQSLMVFNNLLEYRINGDEKLLYE